MKTRDQILEQLQEWMFELFEIDKEKVHLDAHLYEDLDIDSIDAIDLVVKIREVTNKQIKPEDFKDIRFVRDIVDTMEKLQ